MTGRPLAVDALVCDAVIGSVQATDERGNPIGEPTIMRCGAECEASSEILGADPVAVEQAHRRASAEAVRLAEENGWAVAPHGKSVDLCPACRGAK